MEKDLIEHLSLSIWYEKQAWTHYPLEADERRALHGKPIEYLYLKASDYKEGEINIISACLGMGKTHSFKHNLEGTVCLITPRKAIAEQFIKDSTIDFV